MAPKKAIVQSWRKTGHNDHKEWLELLHEKEVEAIGKHKRKAKTESGSQASLRRRKDAKLR